MAHSTSKDTKNALHFAAAVQHFIVVLPNTNKICRALTSGKTDAGKIVSSFDRRFWSIFGHAVTLTFDLLVLQIPLCRLSLSQKQS